MKSAPHTGNSEQKGKYVFNENKIKNQQDVASILTCSGLLMGQNGEDRVRKDKKKKTDWAKNGSG